MLLPNFYHPFFLYCVKTPTNDDGNFGELEFLCTFVAKSKPLSKTRQSIANRTVSKSLPEHQPIVRNTLLQRVVAFLSKVTQKVWQHSILAYIHRLYKPKFKSICFVPHTYIRFPHSVPAVPVFFTYVFCIYGMRIFSYYLSVIKYYQT